MLETTRLDGRAPYDRLSPMQRCLTVLTISLFLVACGGNAEIGTRKTDQYVTTIPAATDSPEWMSLSKRASIETQNKRFEQALMLMDQSLRIAINTGASPDVIWCLRCKTCEVMVQAEKFKKALAIAETFLQTLQVADWRQTLMKLRLLEIKRTCLLHLDRFEEARIVSDEMNKLDIELLGDRSPERTKRLTRTIELDFVTGKYSQVADLAKLIEPDVRQLENDCDPATYELTALLGLSQMLSGNTAEGRINLARAERIEDETGKKGLSIWVEKAIEKLDRRAEIYRLLKR
ncbi:MAG: hypothetical protein K2X93_29070 [Candidatus Obscuribacterales bacterium]|nr:hypothetical protein [Candidatus Obscuribacterales bacterium]